MTSRPEPTLTYLQLLAPAAAPARPDAPEVVVKPIDGHDVRELTLGVGRDFAWPSQRWDDDMWTNYLADRGFRHWAGIASGRPIGILSVNLQSAPDIEIDSFGILPDTIGQGLGAAFLIEALHTIWALPAERIWLHTSSDDHPHALKNYLARGFTPFDAPRR